MSHPADGAVFRSGLALCSLLFLGVLALGCEDPPPPPEDDPAGEVLYFEPIGFGTRARLRDTTEVVIRDSTTWAAYRDSLTATGPFRPVDFSQAVVLLAAVPAPSGGHLVEFEAVELVGDTLVAQYVLSVPGADCITAMGLTTPFQAVLARRTEAPARFVRRTEAYSCEL
ncbi:hypothetical protein AWN76_009780 [Rhodothermaceae bacterium RA]|nr:hypothetical protein AWN76_009780 [Rhodothermaceae bacterium RA]